MSGINSEGAATAGRVEVPSKERQRKAEGGTETEKERAFTAATADRRQRDIPATTGR